MRRIGHLADLADRFRPGMSCVVHTGCAAPPTLARQLGECASALGQFGLFDATPMGGPTYLPAVRDGVLNLSVTVPGRDARELPPDRRATVRRMAFSEVPPAFASGQIPVDLLLLHVAPPDASGRFSLGLSCDAMRAALLVATMVVAQVNALVPRTTGDNLVEPHEIGFLLDATEPPLVVAPARPDETDVAIAGHVAGLIHSYDVLQMGIGAIPGLVMDRISHLTHLGIHSGIISDPVQRLMESGAVTSETGLQPGAIIATMAAGTATFTRFLHENRRIVFLPCDATHDHATLARLRNLCSVNTALEVDFHGNVNAETLGGRAISAPGGLPDFTRGAAASPGGRSIVTLRATSRDGATSRIVPSLGDAPVTVAGEHVSFVVTEHGAARLTGLAARARALALIGVAAPQHRAGLRAQLERV